MLLTACCRKWRVLLLVALALAAWPAADARPIQADEFRKGMAAVIDRIPRLFGKPTETTTVLSRTPSHPVGTTRGPFRVLSGTTPASLSAPSLLLGGFRGPRGGSSAATDSDRPEQEPGHGSDYKIFTDDRVETHPIKTKDFNRDEILPSASHTEGHEQPRSRPLSESDATKALPSPPLASDQTGADNPEVSYVDYEWSGSESGSIGDSEHEWLLDADDGASSLPPSPPLASVSADADKAMKWTAWSLPIPADHHRLSKSEFSGSDDGHSLSSFALTDDEHAPQDFKAPPRPPLASDETGADNDEVSYVDYEWSGSELGSTGDSEHAWLSDSEDETLETHPNESGADMGGSDPVAMVQPSKLELHTPKINLDGSVMLADPKLGVTTDGSKVSRRPRRAPKKGDGVL
ncbi:hypothetical protein CXG81DRAFT_21187 [Caulochytrium protostelioides]|uniref:Uncharacterized protein n=1 Tax=Caulochytrium protostelioides TaxID=1555241 RepID=A0A4P9X2K2_9FUNG|nr:hypothetical protein CXG81DRAFT_21187 [Caulochytrium protostelioides]|eukprot:RKO98606.1 hypothetical protein CXG81DRAFT_21187 [Caulochytrium protostelioides]